MGTGDWGLGTGDWEERRLLSMAVNYFSYQSISSIISQINYSSSI
ncbi:hypothetical protein [Nostoc sp. CMAA1605]|nr:hypothetical protein [Nostoc sp. CMAA1605]